MTAKAMKSSITVSPDLDWSQIRETVRMLFLAVAQIEIAMRESDDSVEHLTSAFTTMVEYENNIARAVEQLPDSEATREIRESITFNTQMVTQEMQGAIIAFQFYDKLTQRLSHVGSSIQGLSELVNDISKLYSPMEWHKLQQQIKSSYSMREEYEIFDRVMNGMNVREAVRQYNEMHKQDLENDIEFF